MGIYSAGPNILFAWIFVAIWALLFLLLYFIPSFIAYKKNHLQKTAILLLNIFLGWTFLGWVVALIWSVKKENH